MKNKVYILVLLILLAALFATPTMASDSTRIREQQIKAAFLYNFIKFVDWPKEKMPDNDEPIIISIICTKDFIKAFDSVKDKQIRGKKIVIKLFDDLNGLEKSKEKYNSKWNQTIESLKKSHILMFGMCDSTKTVNMTAIMEELKGTPVLIAGEHPGLLEKGCNINFLVEKKKVRFEINLVSARQNNLKIRSKLLKLAKRVIDK